MTVWGCVHFGLFLACAYFGVFLAVVTAMLLMSGPALRGARQPRNTTRPAPTGDGND